MRGTAVLGLVLLLAVAGTATAGAPNWTWQGDNWKQLGNTSDFYRFTHLIFDDGMGHILSEYNITDVSYEFTAGTTETAAAVRLLLGDSDDCQENPNITVQIQTDNNGSPSGTNVGTAWTGTIGTWGFYGGKWRYSTGGTYDFPVGEAELVTGQVYHIRMTANNVTAGTGQSGGDGGAPVDFRLYTSDGWSEIRYSDPNGWDWDRYKTRTYDGMIDPNLYGKAYDTWTSTWSTGMPGGAPGSVEDERYKLQTPLFQMYATATTASTKTGVTGADPLSGLGQGYDLGTVNRLIGVSGSGINPAHAPVCVAETAFTMGNAAPAVQKVRLYLSKNYTGGTWVWDVVADPNAVPPVVGVGHWSVQPSAPDVPILVEIQNAVTGAVIAKATIDQSALPDPSLAANTLAARTGARALVEATLTDPAGNPVTMGEVLPKGGRYRIAVKAPGLTAGYYITQARQTAATIPAIENTYRGYDAYLDASTDGGTTWAYNNNQDMVASLQMVLPGDASDDGFVDVGDLGILGYNYGTLTGMTWTEADFNGDGAVDVGDLGVLGSHYGESWQPTFPPVGGAAVGGMVVPEPATLGLLALGAMALIRRRK